MSVKEDVVYAWLLEQRDVGKVSEKEVLDIYNCKNPHEWLNGLRALVSKTNDATPLEILTGKCDYDCSKADSYC